jgi:hypothetical protein
MHHGCDFFRRAGLEGGGVDFVGSVHLFEGRAVEQGQSQGLSFYRDQLSECCKTSKLQTDMTKYEDITHVKCNIASPLMVSRSPISGKRSG